MTSTYFCLMAEFNTAAIPLDAICKKYLNKSPDTAVRLAQKQQLPFPVYRTVNDKNTRGYFVDVAVLAEYLDQQRKQGETEWQRVNL
jgi:hypothetical protein